MDVQVKIAIGVVVALIVVVFFVWVVADNKRITEQERKDAEQRGKNKIETEKRLEEQRVKDDAEQKRIDEIRSRAPKAMKSNKKKYNSTTHKKSKGLGDDDLDGDLCIDEVLDVVDTVGAIVETVVDSLPPLYTETLVPDPTPTPAYVAPVVETVQETYSAPAVESAPETTSYNSTSGPSSFADSSPSSYGSYDSSSSSSSYDSGSSSCGSSDCGSSDCGGD